RFRWRMNRVKSLIRKVNPFKESRLKRQPQKIGSENNLENLDNPIAHCIAGQIGDGMQTKLTHQVGAMGLRCFDAEIEGHSDFLAGLPLGEQLNDLALSSSQNVAGVVCLASVPSIRPIVAIAKAL